VTAYQTGERRKRRRYRRSFVVNALWAAGGLAVMTVAGLTANVLITHSLAPDEVGAYFVFVSLVMVLAVIARMGLDYGVVRFVGTGMARGESGVARMSIRISLETVGMCAAVIGVLVVALWNDWISELATGSKLALGLGGLVALLLAADAVRLVASEVFRGFGDIRRASVYGDAMRGVIFLSFLGAARVLWSNFDLARCLQVACVASAVTCLWVLSAVRRRTRHLDAPAPVARRRLLGQSTPMMVTSLASLLLTQSAVLVAGGVLDARSAALYGVALRVALLLEAPLFVANAVVLPVIVRLHTSSEHDELERVLRRTATIVSLVMLAAVVFLILAGAPLMRVLFGSFFVAAAPIVGILAVSQLVNALAGSSGITLSMTGNERIAMFISMTAAVAAVVLEVVLGQLFGINGVAVGAAIGVIAANVGWVAAVRARLGIVSAASFGIAWRWLVGSRGGRSATA
jgi:O-antigen/teichoic acid export membrane protein